MMKRSAPVSSLDCFHVLVEAQVGSRPGERPAVEFEGAVVSYEELNRRSNRLAHHLAALGVGPEVPVGLCMARGPDIVVAMLAIAKAGGAYVPIDPGERPARRDVVLADSGLRLLIHDGTADIALPDGVEGVDIVADAERIAALPASNPPCRVGADNLAYIIFTSGSSGRPKGVAMTHRSLANLLAWHAAARPASGARRTLQFCSVGFDFSFHEIFSTLAGGGTLVMADERSRRDPFALARLVRERTVERLFLPVTALLQWAEAVAPETMPTQLREIVTTGEALQITPALRAICRAGGVQLHNHYGGTEFQDATTLTLAGDPASWPERPAIGRPIAGVEIRLLDEALEPVADGAPGQLHVAGRGLARGYVARPDLTVERFIADPRDGERLYATGDLARRRSDGAYESLGRADAQLKIRGVRVEPGEVEALLRAHPDVGEAAVAGRSLFGRVRLLAWVVPRAGTTALDPLELLRHLGERLPEAFVPDAVLPVARLPLTDSGKLDWNALPLPALLARPLSSPAAPPRTAVQRQIADAVRALLNLDAVGVRDSFFDLGATSLTLIELQHHLSEALGVPLTTVDLFRWPTAEALAGHVEARIAEASGAAPARARSAPVRAEEPIAIVGLSGRFPDASDVEHFWSNLAAGHVAGGRLSACALEQPDPSLAQDPAYVAASASIEGVDLFDAGYFDVPPREAALLDPQHRLLLELAVTALEDAGHGDPASLGAVGVFAGCSLSAYFVNNVAPHFGYGPGKPFVEADMEQFQAKLANDRNYLATRISYKLGLEGPSLNVQTACSTSLVAVHLACRSLLDRECDAALAGGLSLIVPQHAGYLHEPGMIRSADGRCRAFDADADGTFFANGGGLVLLRRLSDALADGDDVRAVILGSAVNNDGARKAGFTAPSFERQVDVIVAALERARVDPRTIGYVEAHGTGTPIGDPIEVAALDEAFRRVAGGPLPRASCGLGSVKPNIGHLDEAAGIAGLIKTVEALRRRLLPPTAHFRAANPALRLDSTPFVVRPQAQPWEATGGPRRAGVSAFGMGGANCHVVLEEAAAAATPALQPNAVAGEAQERPIHLLAVSGRDEKALAVLGGAYLEALATLPADGLADFCFTANAGRRHSAYRLAVAGGSPRALVDALEAALPSAAAGVPPPDGPGKVCFLFPGQGAHAPGAARALYEGHPVFREAIEECDHYLRGRLETPVRALLTDDAAAEALVRTRFQQPALFVLGHALSRLWTSWGVPPDMVAGHSLGEYVAACLAGRLSLEGALDLVVLRGALVEELALPGRMAMVTLPASETRRRLSALRLDLSIAAENADDQTVVSGPPEAVETFARAVEADGVACLRLDVGQGFHSSVVEPVAAPFAERTKSPKARPGQLPMVSTVTGRIVDPGPLPDDHWTDHLRKPVLFAAALRNAYEAGARTFIELGARPVLTRLSERVLKDVPALHLASGDHRGFWPCLLESLGRYYRAGGDVDWTAFDAPWPRRRRAIPTYPFQRQSYWIERPAVRPACREEVPGRIAAQRPEHPLLGRTLPVAGSPTERRFESRLGADDPAWLGDHRIFGEIVMPAVGLMETVVAAARAVGLSGGLELSGFIVHRAMAWLDGEATRRVQTVVSGSGDTRAVRIYSQSGDADDDWVLHASATVGAAGEGATPVAADGGGWSEASIEAVFAAERERRIDLGPAFRTLAGLRTAPGAGAAQIALSAQFEGEAPLYCIHPLLLEAGYLTLTAIYPEMRGRRSYVPFGVERAVFGAAAGLPHSCRVLMRRSDGEDDDPEILLADIDFTTQDGTLLVALRGVSVKVATPAAMLAPDRSCAPARAASASDHYARRLRPRTLPATTTAARPDRWLVVAKGALAVELAGALKACGVAADAAATEGAGDVHPALASLGNGGWFGIIDATGLACDGGDAPADVGIGRARSIPALVASLADLARPPRLVFAARAVEPNTPGQRVSPENAWLPGLVRALATEHPDLAPVLIDFESDIAIDELARDLAAELRAAPPPGASGLPSHLVWRSGRRFEAVLEPCSAGAGGDGLRFRPDRTYVVTGGTGGLGPRLVHWLLQRGAGAVLVASRRGGVPAPPEGFEPPRGKRVVGIAIDVGEAGPLGQAISSATADGRLTPIGGVFHLAGILDDGVITRLNRDRFEAVMSPKARGAWALHAATLQEPVEHFVLFSSASAVLGTAGQSSYAAANAMLDGLAAHRRSLGLPALSVAWPSWTGPGMSDVPGLAERLRRRGERLLTPDGVLERLAALMSDPELPPSVAVLPFDWSRMEPSAVPADPPAAPSALPEASAAQAAVQAAPADPRSRLLATPVARRGAWVESLVKEKLRAILGVEGPIDREAGFFHLGLDSLSSIELRNDLKAALGISLGHTATFDHPTVSRLARELIRQMPDIAFDSRSGSPPEGEGAGRPEGKGTWAAEAAVQPVPNGPGL